MEMDFRVAEIEYTELNTKHLADRNIKLFVARLDKIHQVISGNKLFKLRFFMEEAMHSGYETILSFGGAYSNHLVATAYYGQKAGLKCIGIVRGERPANLSHTLIDCENYGMQLHFVSRERYRNKESAVFQKELYELFGDCYIIPEGGYHPLGAKGAARIMDLVRKQIPTHVCTAVGTATTLAGLLRNENRAETIIGIPVIKNFNDLDERINYLNFGIDFCKPVILKDYHFNGYAKKTLELVDFMNELYGKYGLATDFIYTAKMMYAIMDKLKENYFPDNSIIVCLHTGGLQGNLSLPENRLLF